MNTFFFTFKKEIGATLPKNPLFNQLKINLCLDLVLLRNRLHPGPKTIVPKLFGSLWVSCSFCVSFSLFLSLFLIDTIEDDTKKTNGYFKLYFPHLISIARDGAPPGVVLHGDKIEERHAHKTSAQGVGFFNIGSGRVTGYWTKYQVAGRVGVSKYTIGYFRVPFLLSGISGYLGYVGYFQVFLGLPIYTRIIF